jgi:hypothetical protein
MAYEVVVGYSFSFRNTNVFYGQGSLCSLLEIFLMPPKVSKMRNLLCNDSDQGVLKNLWLLSPSFHSAFRNGHVNIRPKLKIDWDEEDECEIADATEARVCQAL